MTLREKSIKGLLLDALIAILKQLVRESLNGNIMKIHEMIDSIILILLRLFEGGAPPEGVVAEIGMADN